MKEPLINKITSPIYEFAKKTRSGGIVLFITVIIALVLANSPLSKYYFGFLHHHFGFAINGETYLNLELHHWINDGLMAIFFFVVGLELKKEIVAGELSDLRKSLLPIVAAIGGMVVPAVIYVALNFHSETTAGWGIPMATDIAFSLGVLYFLGDRIPLSVKVFLTALAIVDDLGAVLVIAFFYTSDISFVNLGIGLALLAFLYVGKRIGIRSVFFYGLFGIVIWIAFLLSGIHATIAAVLVAFMIPANVAMVEKDFIAKTKKNLEEFKQIDPNGLPTLSEEQLHLIEKISADARSSVPPLQRLEHALQPFVTFFVVPIFALANAGVSLSVNMSELLSTNVMWGVALGLFLGKVLGIFGGSYLLIKSKIATFPEGMNTRNLLGVSLLATIGFTMSLFVTTLAFEEPLYINQAKIGIFAASILGGILGYIVLSRSSKTND
ncbi:Na(+)/H(+) antiporter NhaA [Capnocytophaga sp. HP1101]